MGIKLTYTLERKIAGEIIKHKIDSFLWELSDRQLESILEVFSESKFRNYQITEFEDEIDGRNIDRVEDFLNEDF